MHSQLRMHVVPYNEIQFQLVLHMVLYNDVQFQLILRVVMEKNAFSAENACDMHFQLVFHRTTFSWICLSFYRTELIMRVMQLKMHVVL